MDEFKGVAKELNLSQEQAQSLIDRVTPAMQARAVENIQRVSREWAERSKNDAEIGGSNYQATQANVWRVISNFGRAADGSIDPDVAEFINSPMGNHPGSAQAHRPCRCEIRRSEDTDGQSGADALHPDGLLQRR